MNMEFDCQSAITSLKRFLTGNLNMSGLSGYVVGLSGGIDSALSGSLAVAAVGPEKVFGVLMPYKTSSDSSIADAKELVEHLGIDHKLVDISPMIDAYFGSIDDSLRMRAGNKMARERMSVLFDTAYEMGRLVLGTGNRTETCLGYTTLFGDSACSVNPIGELYKSQVRQMSKELGVPKAIITKPPSADLWKDQTDEGEIGVTYETIDRILHRVIDEGERSIKKLEVEGLSQMDISRVVSLVNRNAFKRALPPVAPLGRVPVPNSIDLTE